MEPVSPCTTSTSSTGTPSSWLTSWAKVVSSPWPCGLEPVSTVTLPVGCMRTTALSQRPPWKPIAPPAAAGAAVGVGRGGVREDAQNLGRHVLDVVGAGEHQGEQPGRDAGRCGGEVGAQAGPGLDPDRGDGAVPLDGHLDILDMVAAVRG